MVIVHDDDGELNDVLGAAELTSMTFTKLWYGRDEMENTRHWATDNLDCITRVSGENNMVQPQRPASQYALQTDRISVDTELLQMND